MIWGQLIIRTVGQRSNLEGLCVNKLMEFQLKPNKLYNKLYITTKTRSLIKILKNIYVAFKLWRASCMDKMV